MAILDQIVRDMKYRKRKQHAHEVGPGSKEPVVSAPAGSASDEIPAPHPKPKPVMPDIPESLRRQQTDHAA